MAKNIYKIGKELFITNDEEIGTDEYYFHLKNNEYYNSGRIEEFDKDMKFWRKIILTTNQDLIKEGIQAIDDEFLEWFVKNPNCEEVEVEKDKFFESVNYHFYKIIIPKEEPKITNCGNNNCQSGVINGVNPKLCRKCNPKEELKQETLEEVADTALQDEINYWYHKTGSLTSEDIVRRAYSLGIKESAKWQQERSYSEEEVLDLLYKRDLYIFNKNENKELELPVEWFENYKKQ